MSCSPGWYRLSNITVYSSHIYCRIQAKQVRVPFPRMSLDPSNNNNKVTEKHTEGTFEQRTGGSTILEVTEGKSIVLHA